MKKDNRKQYLRSWLGLLKGKTEINFKDIKEKLAKKYKDSYSKITLNRYAATLMGNLYENKYVTGPKGRGYTAGPLAIAKPVSLPVLTKCLTRDFSKIKLDETSLTAVPVKKAAPVKKKPATKKITRKKTRPVAKKITAKKAKARPGKKRPSRRVPVKSESKRPPRGELIRITQGPSTMALEISRQIAELENRIAAYERLFDSLRGVFSREFDEMENWFAKVFK
jgi:hypothetical protein